jgi:hypothetical protein
MTQGIEKFLDLPPLDEVLKRQGVNAEDDPIEINVHKVMTDLREFSARSAMLEGTDHSEAMDSMHDEIITHARDLMTYGYNIDMPRQRGIFEIASILYGHAMNAKNTKRDAELKALRLALDRRKVDLEEKRTNHVIGQQAASIDDVGTIIVEDRNELLKRLRTQLKDQK